MGLLGIPRATTWRAQPVHDGDHVEQAGTGHVPGADDHLDWRRIVQPGDFVRDGIGEALVAVGGAQPDDVVVRGAFDQVASEQRG